MDTVEPSKTLTEYVEAFNCTIKRLVVDLVTRHPNDATIWRVKERVLIAIDRYPVYIIDQVGPCLYKYREQIYKGDESFFMESNYDKDLRNDVDAGRAELVAYIIPKVKEAASKLNSEDRADYYEMVQDMLDDYVEYLAMIKIDGVN